jgi:hypothetical protein
VGTEHLLLGLLADPSGTLAQVVGRDGVTVADVRVEVGGVPEPARAAGQVGR